MTALDVILEGIEAELALERELGVRSFPCDRSLVSLPKPASVSPSPVRTAAPSPPAPPPPMHAARAPVEPVPPPPASSPVRGASVAFVHDRPLSPAGEEMMSKIVKALGFTPETAPVLLAPAPSNVKIVVVLGANALKKFYPGMKGAPGVWTHTPDGREMLVSYSPEYILRFSPDAPSVQLIKKQMWLSLKTVLQHLRALAT